MWDRGLGAKTSASVAGNRRLESVSGGGEYSSDYAAGTGVPAYGG